MCGTLPEAAPNVRLRLQNVPVRVAGGAGAPHTDDCALPITPEVRQPLWCEPASVQHCYKVFAIPGNLVRTALSASWPRWRSPRSACHRPRPRSPAVALGKRSSALSER